MKTIIKGGGLRLSQNNGLGEVVMAGDIVRLRPDRVFYNSFNFPLCKCIWLCEDPYLLESQNFSTVPVETEYVKYMIQARFNG